MVVFALALTMAGSVRNAQAAAKTMTGDLNFVDIDAKTLIVNANKGEATVTVDDKTMIIMGRQYKSLAGLKPAKQVQGELPCGGWQERSRKNSDFDSFRHRSW